MMLDKSVICIIGLGYVGLPLAIEFGKFFDVVGYDKSLKRISKLKQNIDITGEVSKKELIISDKILFTNKIKDVKKCNTYILAIPTPISKNNTPDLNALLNSTKQIARVLKENDTIIYESTVYPGVTDDICVPILEKYSGLKLNKNLFVGYSPERINPGDKKHNIRNIVKITSGSNKKTLKYVDKLYKNIVQAGTYPVSSIKVAEAAKVIENTQRDVNIALINELSIIFNRIEISTEEVLKAASTKWNFINFKPGLVGGHCIGVDPYYLAYQAKQYGVLPKIILAGRETNDKMSKEVSHNLISALKKKKIKIKQAKVLIMGLAFKENCKDIRNTKVYDLYRYLSKKVARVDCYDPFVNPIDAKKTYNIPLVKKPKSNSYDAIIIAVAHKIFKKMGINEIKKLGKENNIIYDLKFLFKIESSDLRL